MQSSWHFYLQFVLERVSLTLYFDKTAKLPVHNLSLSYLQIQLVRSAPNLGSRSLWVAPSLFFPVCNILPSLLSLFLCMGKADRIWLQNLPIFLPPPFPSIFKLSSYCPDAMLTVQCRQQYFFCPQNKTKQGIDNHNPQSYNGNY